MTNSRKSSDKRPRMICSSRINAGQSLEWRLPSSDGPARSWDNTRLVSSGNSPASPANRPALTLSFPTTAFCAGIRSSVSDQFMRAFSQEIDDRNPRDSMLIIPALPFHDLVTARLHTVTATQGQVTDDRAQSLRGGVLLHNLRNGCLGMLRKNCADVRFKRAKIDFRLRD